MKPDYWGWNVSTGEMAPWDQLEEWQKAWDDWARIEVIEYDANGRPSYWIGLPPGGFPPLPYRD